MLICASRLDPASRTLFFLTGGSPPQIEQNWLTLVAVNIDSGAVDTVPSFCRTGSAREGVRNCPALIGQAPTSALTSQRAKTDDEDLVAAAAGHTPRAHPWPAGLVASAGSACMECTNVTGCPDAAPTGCGDSAPHCVRHGTQCVCKSTDIGTSGHAYYGAAPGAPTRFAALEYDTIWTQMPATGSNCYASMMMYWGGAGGYMGSQLYSDGEQWVLFSIWDHNLTVKNSHAAAANCLRFGGEGEGSHCPVTMKLRVGARYQFHVVQTAKNSSGVVWTATVTDLGTQNLTTIGSLYWDEAAAGVPLGTISNAPIAFQEYYTGGNFSSAVGFVGPFGIDDTGAKHEMATATCISDGECCFCGSRLWSSHVYHLFVPRSTSANHDLGYILAL